jgi:hypothetical protein
MTPYERGIQDCGLDDIENAHFSSIGGLNNRTNPKAPDYIKEEDKLEYLQGYIHRAKQLYGADWQTVKFEWKPALLIKDTGETQPLIKLIDETERRIDPKIIAEVLGAKKDKE